MRVVVTGGSKGLGAAIVTQLCHDGHDVLAVARGAADLDALAERTGCAVLATDVSQVGRVVEWVDGHWGGLQ